MVFQGLSFFRGFMTAESEATSAFWKLAVRFLRNFIRTRVWLFCLARARGCWKTRRGSTPLRSWLFMYLILIRIHMKSGQKRRWSLSLMWLSSTSGIGKDFTPGTLDFRISGCTANACHMFRTARDPIQKPEWCCVPNGLAAFWWEPPGQTEREL